MNRMQLLAATAILIAAPAAAADDVDPRVASSRAAAKAYATAMQSMLMNAFEAGERRDAIAICNVAAPEIAADVSEEEDWKIARTSHKLRNPSNAPDPWERRVLDDFLAKAQAGADLAKLEHWEEVEAGGRRAFRYMKAIPTGNICLTCHGDDIDAPIAARLDELYPQDQARGFKLGELRGAFTITQPLD